MSAEEQKADKTFTAGEKAICCPVWQFWLEYGKEGRGCTEKRIFSQPEPTECLGGGVGGGPKEHRGG